jgi:hypothetical protein
MLTRRVFPLFFAGLAAGLAPAQNSDAPPVKVAVTVSPAAVAAGSDAQATLQLTPNPGIKLNKYPKIKLQLPAEPGVAAAAEASIGNTAPPPADHLDANYYKGEVDPLVVKVHLDSGAARGTHDLRGKLSYFYCVAASGYCAPAKVDVTVPVAVR